MRSKHAICSRFLASDRGRHTLVHLQFFESNFRRSLFEARSRVCRLYVRAKIVMRPDKSDQLGESWREEKRDGERRKK